MHANAFEDRSEGDVYHPDASICTISSASGGRRAASHMSPAFDLHNLWYKVGS